MPIQWGFNILNDARNTACYKKKDLFKMFYLIKYFRNIWLITDKNKKGHGF